jgi:hypothetical protein
MNVVVLRGRVAAVPQWFDTRDGGRVAGFDLVIDGASGRERVPVSFTDPPAWVADVGPDDDIAVRGRVRKRFVRAGASSRPFTDVVVEHAVRGGRRRQIDQLVARAVEQLGDR